MLYWAIRTPANGAPRFTPSEASMRQSRRVRSRPQSMGSSWYGTGYFTPSMNSITDAMNICSHGAPCSAA